VSLIGLLVPDAVVAVEAFDDVPGEAVFPGEEQQIAKAVESRRREFVTGRRLAREALRGLGIPYAAIPAGPQREPVWPPGVAGSITHCAGYRAAAVARRTEVAWLGIDAEPNAPLPDGVLEHVSVPGEPAMLARLTEQDDRTHWDRLLFSAKESIYKAWFPLTGRWLGFDEARLTIDPAGQRFVGEIMARDAPMRAIGGRYLLDRGLVITAACESQREA
jgi:4'-phosphopantetheinyl transferase EntD